VKYIGYIEIAVGVGLSLGPTVGSLFYPYLHYQGTMYLFGILNFAALLICNSLLPSILNESASYSDDSEQEETNIEGESRREEITWMTLLRNKECFFAIAICFFGTSNVIFFEGFMASLLHKLGLAQDSVGYIFGLNSLFYLIGCLILPYTFEKSPRKL
jgi:predicted MFS family arabinose efflux permease